jgi:two-component system, NtrC family, sensor kinase
MRDGINTSLKEPLFKANLIRVLIFLLVFLSGYKTVSAQDIGEPVYITELRYFGPGFVDSIWKYKDSCQGNLTDTSFNDEDWQLVNTQSLTDLNGKPPESWKGNGWFRKWFTVPDSMRGKTIVLMMGHIGTSKIYLDGKLIKQYGMSVEGVEKTKPFMPHEPFFVKLGSQPRHLLTVQFSGQTNKDVNIIAFPGFKLLVSSPERVGLQLKKPFPIRIISVSFMIAFFLFFCFVYCFYPDRISSLLCALLLADFSVVFITILIGESTTDGLNALNVFYWWKASVSMLSGISLLFFYAAYYGKLIRRCWIIVGLMIINFFGIVYFTYSNISNIVATILTIESYRIIIIGLRDKKSGFQILMIGNIIDLLGSYLVIFNRAHLFPSYPTTLHTVLDLATDLNLPLFLALYLAWDFGSTNRNLRVQLAQVNKLSLENIKKEQEKQLLLSSQNETLEKQVKERTGQLTEQKNELEATLENLKSTQAQLIQSEKMASLGELTAGIAHEIQNPLNFVNNFSEVNSELIKEMQDEIAKGNMEEIVKLANDIRENEQKISHHGKRADTIVKGMLQHSSKNSGLLESIDINALVDEYLRLAYHGLRAKDKSFNATLKTDYDPKLQTAEIIPQDIGRVLLNLFNNAFFALGQKKKTQPAREAFEPEVTVKTRKIVDKIEIRVADNGNGIPPKIMNKIFQPFFTTKPAGQGTGLGLSLSYDIIKAHGGELKAESIEGEGATFIVLL